MMKKRKQYNPQFKFKVALEAIKELKTINEIAGDCSVHPSQVKNWKIQLLTEGPTVFVRSVYPLTDQEIRGFQMMKKREQYNQQFKFKVALEAIKEPKTINEIAGDCSVHPSQVKNWKIQLLTEGPTVFVRSDYSLTDQEIKGIQKALDTDPVRYHRLRAIYLLGHGYKPDQVASIMGVTVDTVYRWRRRWQKNGLNGLYYLKVPSSPSIKTEWHEQMIPQEIIEGLNIKLTSLVEQNLGDESKSEQETESKEKPRRVRIGILDVDEPETAGNEDVLPASAPLECGRKYFLRIDISAEAGGSNVVDPVPIPKEVLDRVPEGETLDVVVFSEDFDLLAEEAYRHVQPLALQRGKASPFVYVQIAAPRRPGIAECWVCIYYYNTLLQWLLTRARIVTDTDAPGTSDLGNESRVLYTISPTMTQFDILQSPSVSLLYDSGRGRLSVKKGQDASDPIPVLPSLGGILGKVRQHLAGINRDEKGNYPFLPENRGSKSNLAAFLLPLADWGKTLFDSLINDNRQRKKLRDALDEPGIVEIAHSAAGNVIPWSMVYDLPFMSQAEAKQKGKQRELCLLWDEAAHQKQGLENGEIVSRLDFMSCRSAADCPLRRQDGESERDYRKRISSQVCVYGFWGYKHQLQQPPGLLPEDTAPNSKTFSPFINVGKQLSLDVLANPKIGFWADHQQELIQLKSPDVQVRTVVAYTTTAIENALDNKNAHIVYFYCHGDSREDLPRLLVGQNNFPLTLSELSNWDVSWPDAPLVIINGCETVTYSPKAFTSMVIQFRGLNASGVIGTEIEVFPILARWFGREFISRFLQGSTVGQIMRDLRLDLLQRYNILGFVYTNYTLAGLRLRFVKHPVLRTDQIIQKIVKDDKDQITLKLDLKESGLDWA